MFLQTGILSSEWEVLGCGASSPNGVWGGDPGSQPKKIGNDIRIKSRKVYAAET